MSGMTVEGTRDGDVLVVTWHDAKSSGSCRFVHVSGTRPEWLGETDELLTGADRRQEGRVLDAVAAWAKSQDLELGLWTDGVDVEVL